MAMQPMFDLIDAAILIVPLLLAASVLGITYRFVR